MAYALTLVSALKKLSAGVLAEVENFLDAHKIFIERDPNWLSDHEAADLIIHDALSKNQMDDLREKLSPHKIDVFCLSSIDRRKKLLCADMESTIIENEMLEELAERLNLKDKIAEITARAMNGEIDFTQSLIERTALLKGLPESTLVEFLPTLKINGGAKTLVKTMAAHDAICVLATGGFTFFSAAIKDEVSFHHHHANTFEINDGELTGNLINEILDPDAKLKYLQHYADHLNIDPSDSMAIGDGANDLPMLNAAGFGVGYRPKPILQDSLINQIHHCDMTAALYAQGYRKEEFVTT